MYSPLQLATKYLRYFFTASNGKGHGIHSPFVFEFVKFVLNDKKQYPCYTKIESLRSRLLKDNAVITVEDFGAGSATIKTNKRMVSRIAATSLKSRKFSQLLFRIVQYYKPKNIIELGTSLGTSTAYLASGNDAAKVFTFEGAAAIAAIAQDNFEKLGFKHIELVLGNFDKTFSSNLPKASPVYMAFVDGNHRKIPTLEYFEQILSVAHSSAIIIMDDIHWSCEMEEAWVSIQQHHNVTLTIDLFFIGLVFINPAFKVKQHFKIRF